MSEATATAPGGTAKGTAEGSPRGRGGTAAASGSGGGSRRGSRAVSPTAPPRSFVWTRRIVLTLLTLFAGTPLLVMVSSSLKPLQDVSDRFRWIPSSLTTSPYVDIWSTVPLADYFLKIGRAHV